MTTVSLRMDDETKRELDDMCAEMGISISAFYMLYTKKALRERRIPFEIDAPLSGLPKSVNYDKMTEAEYTEKINASYEQALAGNTFDAAKVVADLRAEYKI